jgi:hypothetical protein
MLRWPPHVIPVARGQPKLLPCVRPWNNLHYDIQLGNPVKESAEDFS